MYQNYIFDLYGTLVDINTDEDQEKLWKTLSDIFYIHYAEYTPEELQKTYVSLVKEEKGKTIEKYPNHTHIDVDLLNVFRRLFEIKGVKQSEETVEKIAYLFRFASRKYINLYEGASRFLKELKDKGKNVYLLTNAQRCFTVPELKLLGIYEFFDDILISSDEKMCKPDTLFYKKLIDKHNLDIKNSIMIGNDCTTDIKGANDIGMHSLYLHTNISPEEYDETLPTYCLKGFDKDEIIKLILK